MGLPDNCIPDDKLPQCWNDDVRMNALFAPFRVKTANPESWDMKMKFWSDMLRQWCKYRKDPIISAADAKFAFQRNGQTPACIDIVVEEMLRNGELSPLTKYQQILNHGPESWVRWGTRLAFKPAVLALTAVSSLLPSRQSLDNDGLPKANIDTTQRLVLESAVKIQANELLLNYPPGVERVGTIEELMKNCNWQVSRETFEILLGYLVSQGSAIKKDDVVKLAEPGRKVSLINEREEAIVKLVCAETQLEKDIVRLSRDAASAEADALVAFRLGNKPVAKNNLRRKNRLVQRLMKCEDTLQNIKELLQQLRDLEVNKIIVDTYKLSSRAMKQSLCDGLEDSVYTTMEDLKEVLETYHEIENVLSTAIDDESPNLEQELKELLSGPDVGSGGGTPDKKKEKAEPQLPSPSKPTSTENVSERNLVLDSEAQMIAKLKELSIDEARTKKETREPVAEALGVPSHSRSPTWNNEKLDSTLKSLDESPVELRQDERLHPGQTLVVDYSTSPKIYKSDFQVQDHKMDTGIWLYNSQDGNSSVDTSLKRSADYNISDSPNLPGGMQMAPDGERKKPEKLPNEDTDISDLEKRLKDLRESNF